MQKENTYHKLFRAHLPVATLPKEFADRLTKSVLDEVNRLYQAPILPLSWPGEQTDNPDPLLIASQTEEAPPLKQPTITLLLLLLVNIHVGLLLQGCTFYQPVTSWYYSVFDQAGAGVLGTGEDDLPAPKTLAAAKVELVWGSNVPQARTLHLPPLEPLKPKLPVVALGEDLLVINSKPSLPQALGTLHRSPARLHDPPTTVITATAMTTAMTTNTALIIIRMPDEQQQTDQQLISATAVGPAPAILTSTTEESALPRPTTQAPVEKPTPTAIPDLLQTPVLSIFEPTMTFTPAIEAPTATTIAEATATPTMYVHPWRTIIPEAVVTPEGDTTISIPE